MIDGISGRTHEFYSGAADFPLAELKPGDVVVTGSDCRYPGRGGTMLYMALLENRCLISVQHELVSGVRSAVQHAGLDSLIERRSQIVDIVQRRLGDAMCYEYAGVKLYCTRETYHPIPDDHVVPITRSNAGKVITDLLDDEVPTDAEYMMAHDAGFAYHLDGRYVAYAGSHPTGSMTDRLGNVYVGAHRDFRGRGYGKAVVSAATGALLDQGKLAVYGTSEANIASQRTAITVGYQVYCRVFELRLASF